MREAAAGPLGDARGTAAAPARDLGVEPGASAAPAACAPGHSPFKHSQP